MLLDLVNRDIEYKLSFVLNRIFCSRMTLTRAFSVYTLNSILPVLLHKKLKNTHDSTILSGNDTPVYAIMKVVYRKLKFDFDPTFSIFCYHVIFFFNHVCLQMHMHSVHFMCRQFGDT